MNTIINRSIEVKEREVGAAYILHALEQRNQFVMWQEEWGNREQFIQQAGDLYPWEKPTDKEIADMRELMDAADKYFKAGYRIRKTSRHDITLSFGVPNNALAWRVVSAGYISTSEQGRLQYLVKNA